jgi:PPM family protein phosphatase
VAQAMADAGYIAPEEVRHHNKKNVLTNFLGGHHGKVKADVRWLRVVDGDRLLLCSDGLTDMVEDATIARILAENDPPAGAAQSLLDEALKCGGRDNVTVIVAGYSIPSPTNPVPREGDSEAQGSTNTTKSLEKMPPLNAGMN